MTTIEVIVIAANQAHRGEMASSAKLAAGDAVRLHTAGMFQAARDRALKSLAYSVGVFHLDYILVAADNANAKAAGAFGTID
jgi:hypothetical protein